jgi:cyclopropane fatty-acyl-phospholipid synthase-like methyltransferase
VSLYKEKWDESYLKKQNYLFYPNEEVVRFASKFLRKQVDLKKFKDLTINLDKLIDIGCGIGRHVIYGNDLGLNAYGVDLSSEAIEFARNWAAQEGVLDAENRLLEASVDKIPFPDDFFDVAVSHGVFDSMSFDVAKAGIVEASRVLRHNAYFYLDLISGDDSRHPPGYCDEEIVSGAHEQDTVQSYFNFEKIINLLDRRFTVVECNLIRRKNILTEQFDSRYHLVLLNEA